MISNTQGWSRLRLKVSFMSVSNFGQIRITWAGETRAGEIEGWRGTQAGDRTRYRETQAGKRPAIAG